jgi:tRNA 2-thiouridine synthesizing protein A
MEPEIWLDERGEKCPMPVVHLARAARDLPPGTAIAVISDDPAAAHDIPAWCRMRRAMFHGEGEPQEDGARVFLVQLAVE